jgi:hypothetical protein
MACAYFREDAVGAVLRSTQEVRSTTHGRVISAWLCCRRSRVGRCGLKVGRGLLLALRRHVDHQMRIDVHVCWDAGSARLCVFVLALRPAATLRFMRHVQTFASTQLSNTARALRELA